MQPDHKTTAAPDPAPKGQAKRLFYALKGWARRLKADVDALASASLDPRVPVIAKLVIVLVVAYALSPIDLIPDFIPVIGYLDDLVILPLGIALAIRLIPAEILSEHRARTKAKKQERKTSRSGALLVIALWLICALLVVWWFL